MNRTGQFWKNISAEDAKNVCWGIVPHLFFDFEYNIDKLKSLGTPIARIKATHNCSKASKHDSTEDDGLHTESYLACRAEVMM